MVAASHPLDGLTLSGNVYLAHEASGAPANGDLRLSQNPNDARYIKVEVLWEGQWHEVESWHWYKTFRRFIANWPDPWALAKIFQRLLQALGPHLEIIFYNRRNSLCIHEETSNAVAQQLVEDALAKAKQLVRDNPREP
jgi:hypothetical protein